MLLALLASAPVAADPLLTEAWTAESNGIYASFGESVSSAGDVNGDGYGDVVVGAPSFNFVANMNVGRVYLYLGTPAGLETTEAWTVDSGQNGSDFGEWVSSAGDVNGDGYGDVVVGAPDYDDGENAEGAAFLYLGSATGLETTAAWTTESDQEFAHLGRSVSSAGDVNGDGYGDVVVGVYGYDGIGDPGTVNLYLGSAAGLEPTAAWTAGPGIDIYFGYSVSSAGDVNADGYGDVIVGTYDGVAHVYLGSAAGLEESPAWTVVTDQDGAWFGYAVASAGDVNGDGYGDVIVGAHEYDNGEMDEGRAYVYFGSASGVGTIPGWVAESDMPDVFFGYSVSSAGDVNGDGYGDVVVGAKFYQVGQSNEGAAYVYFGSALGLEPAAARIVESDLDAIYFGSSVASAGDVNGDGYGDIVVGAFNYTNGEREEGRAYLYLGGCPGVAAISFVDGDADLVPDACDLCLGFDDLIDTDGGGIPDECDLCPDAPDDTDGDGACPSDDCDDTDATVYPGAPELCDGIDNRCAGSVPEDELDADADGLRACAGDCDDDNPMSYLGAAELCDGLDNACAGFVPVDELDADFDSVLGCEGDCDEGNHRSHPGATELCDGLDNDCNASLPAGESDADADGVLSCADDCDDADPAVSPDRIEQCDDGIDNNCDGVVDEACAATGCGSCAGAGGPGGSPLVGLGIALATMRRRQRERSMFEVSVSLPGTTSVSSVSCSPGVVGSSSSPHATSRNTTARMAPPGTSPS